MLVFSKARRKDPTLTSELTPSEKRVQRALLDAAGKVRAYIANNEREFLDAVAHLPWDRVAAMLPLEPWLEAQSKIADEFLGDLVAGGERVSLPSIEKARLSFKFDAQRPEAAAWADVHSATLITQVVRDQQDMVRWLTGRASEGEYTPRDVASILRGSIGLTEQQAGWVSNYRARTIDELLAQGLPAGQVFARADALTDNYYERVHRYRTETIARTEILSASHEGRRQAWQQGMDEGFISPGSRKQWLTVSDPCPECAQMDGITVGVMDEFDVGDPPLHPNCRCDVLLLPPEVEPEFESMSDEDVLQALQDLLDEPDNPNEYRGYELNDPENNPGNRVIYGDEAADLAKQERDRMVAVEPRITREMIDFAIDNNGELVSLDFRLKGEDSLARKIHTKGTAPGADMASAARGMNDIIRYTMLFADDIYAQGAADVVSQLESRGWRLTIKNSWMRGNAYRGINISGIDASGNAVELQLHTPSSYKVKDKVHDIYKLDRVETDPLRKVIYNARMVQISDRIPLPGGNMRGVGEWLDMRFRTTPGPVRRARNVILRAWGLGAPGKGARMPDQVRYFKWGTIVLMRFVVKDDGLYEEKFGYDGWEPTTYLSELFYKGEVDLVEITEDEARAVQPLAFQD